MSRIGRIVVPGLPHHVVQRGNHRARVFFGDDDYALYRDLLAERTRKAGVAVWSWCLMPNHVHLILAPATAESLARAIGETHRRYAGYVNARLRRTGHLFQARFSSAVMDEAHVMTALRYVALNPLRAGLIDRAADWPWSSTSALLGQREDGLTATAPVWDRIADFASLLAGDADDPAFAALRRAEGIGRPLGDQLFLASLEHRLGRPLAPAKRGPKPRNRTASAYKIAPDNQG